MSGSKTRLHLTLSNSKSWNTLFSVAFVISILTFLPTNSPAQANAYPGLVASFPGEGDALDLLGAHNGVLTNGVGFTNGVYGQAFSFNGTNSFVANSPLGSVSNTFTLEFWALPTGGHAPTNDGISGQRYAIMPEWPAYYGLTNGGDCAGVSVGTNGIAVFEHGDLGIPSLLDYTTSLTGWTHIAVVYTNKQPFLYVNASLVATGITSSATNVYPSTALGGDARNYYYGPYQGLLDEVSIYQRALSPEEISAMSASPGAVLVNDLTATTNSSVSVRGPASARIFYRMPNAVVLYTTDGSDPAVSGFLYHGPFTVGRTTLIRTIAYSANFSRSYTAPALQVIVLPTLEATTSGGGTLTISPPDGAYLSNSLAVATATPSAGWTFLQWLGDASGTNPTANVTMTRDKIVTAVFGTTLSTNVVGSGSIVVSPLSDLYPYGSTVRLAAQPNPGSYFVRWGGASTDTNNPLNLPVTNAQPSISALFALVDSQHSALAIIPSGAGQVAVSPPGNLFLKSSGVTLTALPDSGQAFLGWGGDATGATNVLTVTMNTSRTITATFTKRPTMHATGDLAGLTADGFRVLLSGEFGAVYQISVSTNLTDWSLLGFATNQYGTTQFTDPAATNSPARFYRSVRLD